MALVLTPEPPTDQWLEELDRLLARSPAYFVNRPVVVDVSALPQKRPDLMGIVNELQARKIRVMALEGTETAILGADARGLPPIIADGRPSMPIEPPGKNEDTPPPSQPVPRPATSMVIERPVRSGQSIYCPDGDVTVLGSVASGAEIVAGGSIHVYGALRGRALAGWGNRSGRIFCQSLDAELLAVDGLYKTADEIDVGLRGRPIQAWTSGDTLMVEALA
ncbi:septum site-determining protein MinC [Hyphomicrobiales bacterium BP6-180914]|uniref:Probable septum site-determining protein MinC n=2 Tax=Lichenifustis flavocetrariae TaxID=2949735 RepID=A0AA41YSF2_9HYPH|nr:septum site-determining protein MinC [Lichenifustis flavocetrariae]MCW6507724.1 septum site-determining protein MinC [Lichenifustis flavocetrariae]